MSRITEDLLKGGGLSKLGRGNYWSRILYDGICVEHNNKCGEITPVSSLYFTTCPIYLAGVGAGGGLEGVGCVER